MASGPPHVGPADFCRLCRLYDDLSRPRSAGGPSSYNCDYRISAIYWATVAEVELHDEVLSWILGLEQAQWERTVVVIDRLAALGSSARMPFSRSLGDGLFELRFTLGQTARRITYRFTKDGRIILLTTFRKQRDNESIEIARARRAAEDCARTDP